MSYDRAAALAYARKYWRSVATDGFIGSAASDPPYRKVGKGNFDQSADKEVLRLNSGEIVPISDIDDCAHFVSCCIGNPPGGQGGSLSLPSAFPTGPYGQLSAQKLFEKLEGQFGSIVGLELTQAAAKQKLSQITAGDIIFYFDPAKGQYGHCGLFMNDSNSSISCHTYSRCDIRDVEPTNGYSSKWDSVKITNALFTLFHMT